MTLLTAVSCPLPPAAAAPRRPVGNWQRAAAVPSSSTASSGSWKTYCDEQTEPQNPCGSPDATGREWLLRASTRVEGVFDVSLPTAASRWSPSQPGRYRRRADAPDRLQPAGRTPAVECDRADTRPVMTRPTRPHQVRSRAVRPRWDPGPGRLPPGRAAARSDEDGAPLWAITPPRRSLTKRGGLNLLPLRLSTQDE